MKDLKALFNQCMDELDALKIPYSKNIEVRPNSRLTSTWGYCKGRKDGFDISISARLLSDDVSDAAVKSVIHHELLHTVKDCLNHSPKWKSLAAKVSNAYGYPIRRAVSAREMGLEPKKADREVVYKHKFVCENCGAVIARKRESKFTKYYKYYRCGRCNGKFTKLY